MSASKVSFTVRRPTPVSRHTSSGADSDRDSLFKVPALPERVANGSKRRFIPHEQDSSDEEDEVVDEMVTGFDKFGVQRLDNSKKKVVGPLVIPALGNRDWRDAARKRKAGEMFVPDGGRAAVQTGADGSVGGLGTRERINDGPLVAGLVRMENKAKVESDGEDVSVTEITETQATIADVRELSEDDKALQALLAEASGVKQPGRDLTIPSVGGANDWSRPADEGEAFRRDVVTRPDQASLEDYARVPVEEFGAALLRGMGWKPGQAASRTRSGPTTPYLPTQRPALLGIGAKEREVVDDGGTKKGKPNSRPDKRYVPVIRREREGHNGKEDGRRSGATSRRSSRSPEPKSSKGKDGREDRNHDRRRDRDREYERERRREGESDHDSDRRKERERNLESDRRPDRDYDDRKRNRSRDRRDRVRDRERQ